MDSTGFCDGHVSGRRSIRQQISKRPNKPRTMRWAEIPFSWLGRIEKEVVAGQEITLANGTAGPPFGVALVFKMRAIVGYESSSDYSAQSERSAFRNSDIDTGRGRKVTAVFPTRADGFCRCCRNGIAGNGSLPPPSVGGMRFSQRISQNNRWC
jgi:hypothetical protein